MSVIQGKASLVESVSGPLGALPGSLLILSPAESQWAASQDSGTQRRRRIGLIPTHRRESRRWPADSFAALARLLIQAGHEVWLFWGPGEHEYVEAIQQRAPGAWLIPSTTLRQMAALLKRCDLVATNDNGPMHLAVAVDVPTVTVYGPTDPESWNPGGPKNLVLRAANLSCLGCNLNQCPFGHECMQQVTPSQVLAAAESLLRNLPATPVPVSPAV